MAILSKENGGGWEYFLQLLRQVLPGGTGSNDLRGPKFVEAILSRFKDGYKLERDEIGTWFASIQAAEIGDSQQDGALAARFVISREPQPASEVVSDEPLLHTISVTHRFGEPRRNDPGRLFLFFSFTDELPVSRNLKLFEDYTVSCLKNYPSLFKESPPATESVQGAAR